VEASNLRPLRIGQEKRKKKNDEERRKKETTAVKYNGLPYWATIKTIIVQCMKIGAIRL